MAKYNHVELIGNMGSEARIVLSEDKRPMAAFSLATQDSFKNKDGEWKIKQPIWHNILTFNPYEIEKLKSLKVGSRIQVIGSISYRDYEALIEKGKTVKKKEASIIADKIEFSPLPPK